MLRILVVGLVLLVAVMFALRQGLPPPEPSRPAAMGPETQNATPLVEPLALPAFSLTDTSGNPFDRASLEGRFSLMFFGFTHCPDVCPITLQMLAAAVERLEADAPGAVPEVVFVSVDPHRDTPERIRAYLDGFDPSFTGITGSDEQLAPLLTTLGVAVEKHEHDGEWYNVVHNSAVWFIGPGGAAIGISSSPHTSATIAADFVTLRDWHLARQGDAPAQAALAD